MTAARALTLLLDALVDLGIDVYGQVVGVTAGGVCVVPIQGFRACCCWRGCRGCSGCRRGLGIRIALGQKGEVTRLTHAHKLYGEKAETGSYLPQFVFVFIFVIIELSSPSISLSS